MKLSNIILVFVAVVSTFVLFSVGYQYYPAPQPSDFVDRRFETIKIPDGKLLKRENQLPGDSEFLETLDVNGKNIYRSHIITNHFGGRLGTAPSSKAKYHALFIGCSFTFGVGVQGNETVPDFFQAAAPQFHSYNYGIPAAGLHNMAFNYANRELKNEISEPEGIAVVYFYPLEHTFRLHQPMSLGRFSDLAPVYQLSGGNLKLLGEYGNAYPVLSKLYTLAGNIKLFQDIFPRNIGPSRRDLELSIALLKQMRDNYIRNFPKGKFIVMYKKSEIEGDFLKATDLNVVTFPVDINQETEVIPFDGHPRPSANKRIAQSMLKELIAGGYIYQK